MGTRSASIALASASLAVLVIVVSMLPDGGSRPAPDSAPISTSRDARALELTALPPDTESHPEAIVPAALGERSVVARQVADRPLPARARATFNLPGVVRDVDPLGGPIPGAEVEVEGRGHGAAVRKTVTDAQGAFLFEDLDFEGDLELRVRAEGWAPYVKTIAMGTPPIPIFREVWMSRRRALRIRLLTWDGRPLEEWCAGNRDSAALLRCSVVDSDSPLGRRIDPADVARALEDRSITGRRGQYDYDAQLHGPFPRWVSACVGTAVVDSAQIAADAPEEVVLSIPEEHLFFEPVTVRLSVVDAANGLPIPGARASLLPHGSHAFGAHETDARGEVAIQRVKPGAWQLTVLASGYEWIREDVSIARAADCDLGVRALARATTLEGRVVDESGRPLPRFGLVSFPRGRFEATRETRASLIASTDGEGWFLLQGLGPHEHVLRAADPEWFLDTRTADTSAGSVRGLELRASRGRSVAFVLDAPVIDGLLRVVDASGTPVRELSCGGSTRVSCRLGPGEYELTLDASESPSERSTFVVGARDLDIAVGR